MKWLSQDLVTVQSRVRFPSSPPINNIFLSGVMVTRLTVNQLLQVRVLSEEPSSRRSASGRLTGFDPVHAGSNPALRAMWKIN